MQTLIMKKYCAGNQLAPNSSSGGGGRGNLKEGFAHCAMASTSEEFLLGKEGGKAEGAITAAKS